MNPIKAIPNLPWSPAAQFEIALAGDDLVAQSDFAYQIGQVAICGLIYSSYVAPPWFWFALAKGTTLRDLIDFRRTYMEMIPLGAMTAVRAEAKESIRFAEFYGFEATGDKRRYKGHTYLLYRRV